MLDLGDRSSGISTRSVRPTVPHGGTQFALVTGGSGFLGQFLVSALAARGHNVRIFDQAAPDRMPVRAEFVQGSVLDRARVMRALDDITHVYHLAAIPHLWTADRRDFDRVNLGGTQIMLAAARERRVARFVHCSTEAILLPPRVGTAAAAIDEGVALDLGDMPGPYTRSKYLAEQAALAAARDGFDVVIVNPTVPIGAGDHNRTPPAAMLAHYLTNTPFVLNCMLNLVDARDVATGIILAAERGRSGERYILGGENLSLTQLLDRLERMSGRPRRRIGVPHALAFAMGAVSEWVATWFTHRAPIATSEGVRLALRSAPFDSAKARRELGYAPGGTDAALVESVRWLTLAATGRDGPLGELAVQRIPARQRADALDRDDF
jgi:dihydroflavonol-4-reductase